MGKIRIVLASANAGKIKELKSLLGDFDIVGFKELGYDFGIEETGNSFYENALIKAKAVFNATGLPAISDDSGLKVNSLGGAPGIYSARYSGGSDSDNIAKLLSELKGKTDRTAEFSCCTVYYDGKRIIAETGTTKGEILFSPQGENGFGYDPVFYSYDLKKPFGLATEKEKNSVSHRSRAAGKLAVRLKELLTDK
ncbi:MAG: RdgB/HAM1 family non-canonical purine NTP pyrophosphatase [Clostridia bacterium]|nr:RdgB/HAM1 family non-canonical purine NTP pyrophosphatase [Clostridia bacterium]